MSKIRLILYVFISCFDICSRFFKKYLTNPEYKDIIVFGRGKPNLRFSEGTNSAASFRAICFEQPADGKILLSRKTLNKYNAADFSA